MMILGERRETSHPAQPAEPALADDNEEDFPF